MFEFWPMKRYLLRCCWRTNPNVSFVILKPYVHQGTRGRNETQTSFDWTAVKCIRQRESQWNGVRWTRAHVFIRSLRLKCEVHGIFNIASARIFFGYLIVCVLPCYFNALFYAVYCIEMSNILTNFIPCDWLFIVWHRHSYSLFIFFTVLFHKFTQVKDITSWRRCPLLPLLHILVSLLRIRLYRTCFPSSTEYTFKRMTVNSYELYLRIRVIIMHRRR